MKQQKYYYNQSLNKAPSKTKGVVFAVFLSLLLLSGLFAIFQYVTKENVEQDIASAEVIKEPEYNFENIVPPPEGQFAIANLVDGIDINYEGEKLAPIASLTKLITALAVLDKAPITPGEKGDMITLTAQDEQYYWDYIAIEGTVTAVSAGQQISQYEALQTILLASSNNMSDTLVDYYFDSKEEYVNYANNLLEEMGLIYTEVVDTTGFSPENVSTPTEQLLIGKKSLENKVIAEIVTQKDATVSVAGEIPNYNALIDLPYVTGLKPGLTDEAGYCLLFSMDIPNEQGEPVTTIAVVLGVRDTEQYRSFLQTTYDQIIKTIENS